MHWQISCLLFDKVGIVTTSRRLKLVNTANSKPLALQQESSIQPSQCITPEEPILYKQELQSI